MFNNYFIILLSILALPLKAQINIDIDKLENNAFALMKPYLTKENELLLSCWPSNLYSYNLDGKFLNRIHSGDQLPVNTYDREKNYFYLEVLNGRPTWYGIDLKIGEIVSELPKPFIYEKQIVNFKRIGNNDYVCFVNNQSGNDSVFFVFF